MRNIYLFFSDFFSFTTNGVPNHLAEFNGSLPKPPTTAHVASLCNELQRTDQSTIDISFKYSIKIIPTTRRQDVLPQSLIDFRNAARTVITECIRLFRDDNLGSNPTCPISGEPITRDNCAVDHVAPVTFDRLLHKFTLISAINPLHVAVGSRNGTVAEFEDPELHAKWVAYHNANAKLILLSRTGHAQLSTERIDWSTIFRST